MKQLEDDNVLTVLAYGWLALAEGREIDEAIQALDDLARKF